MAASKIGIIDNGDVVPTAERLLDHAIELTFPASDPIAVDHAYGAARAGERGRADAPATVRRQSARKSPRQHSQR